MTVNFFTAMALKRRRAHMRTKLLKNIEKGVLKVIPSEYQKTPISQNEPIENKEEINQKSTLVPAVSTEKPDTSHLDDLQDLVLPKGVNTPYQIGQVIYHDSGDNFPNHKGPVRFIMDFDGSSPVVQDIASGKSFGTKYSYLSHQKPVE